MRFFFYSHDGLGLGHLRRNLAVARALSRLAPDAPILIATGSEELPRHWLPANADALGLPSLRKKGPSRYEPRRLDIAASELQSLRRTVLESAVRSFRPTVLVADKHPLGVERELEPALVALAQHGGRAVLGLRDVLDEPAAVEREWCAPGLLGEIERRFSRILVFGRAEVLRPLPPQVSTELIAARTRYCGYVVGDGCAPQARLRTAFWADGDSTRPFVIATAGAGEDGHPMLTAFVEAAGMLEWNAAVVAGPACPEDAARDLEHLARARGVRFHRFLRNMPQALAEADVVVSMAGYNTIAETLAAGTPIVCVPRVVPRREQLIRARALAERGLVQVVEPERLTASAIADAVTAAAAQSRTEITRRAHAVLGLDGAANAAQELCEVGLDAVREADGIRQRARFRRRFALAATTTAPGS